MLKKILKIAGIAAIVLMTIVAGFFVFLMLQPKPDVSMYTHLLSPKISSKINEKMIQVNASGDPNKVISGAFGSLFNVYYSLNDTPKGPQQPAPRLRMKSDGILTNDTAKMTLDFTLGVPVPEAITALSEDAGKMTYPVELATWEYGEVAEILHIGGYDKEQSTIKKLLDFVASSGYEGKGIHEEEYIIGPGMFFSKPEDYYTVIRYPVKKAVE